MSETLHSLIDQTCLRFPQKEALLFIKNGKIESRITYAAIKKISDRIANGLKETGLLPGETVILFLPKSIEAILFHLGIQKAGAISVWLNPGFKKGEMAYYLKDTDAKMIVAGTREASLIRSIDPERKIIPIDTATPYSDEKLFPSSSHQMIPVKINLSDPALLVYTSGTTGKPKGAVLTQQNLIQDARNILHVWAITEKDVLCHALPLFHIHGLCFALHTSLIAGSRLIMLDEFSAERVIDLLLNKKGDQACTLFIGVPTMYVKMLDQAGDGLFDFSHIRFFASGSAPLSPKDFERIKKKLGQEPLEREGMSETGMNFSNPLKGIRKPGSIGLPLPHVEVRIVDPKTFQDCKTGETGEIWLKGPNVTPGYWRKPLETEKAFYKGWFRTGDMGKKDQDGYYTITDRLKNIIISGGENISPKEVETVLDRHPDIEASCVVGIPDEKWGEQVTAGIILKPGRTLSVEAIKEYCRQTLLDWKCPKKIVFMDHFPRNTMGKIMREEIKKKFDH